MQRIDQQVVDIHLAGPKMRSYDTESYQKAHHGGAKRLKEKHIEGRSGIQRRTQRDAAVGLQEDRQTKRQMNRNTSGEKRGRPGNRQTECMTIRLTDRQTNSINRVASFNRVTALEPSQIGRMAWADDCMFLKQEECHSEAAQPTHRKPLEAKNGTPFVPFLGT